MRNRFIEMRIGLIIKSCCCKYILPMSKNCFLLITLNYCLLIFSVNCIYHCGTLYSFALLLTKEEIDSGFVIYHNIFKTSTGSWTLNIVHQAVRLTYYHGVIILFHVCFPITGCALRTVVICCLLFPELGIVPRLCRLMLNTGSD